MLLKLLFQNWILGFTKVKNIYDLNNANYGTWSIKIMKSCLVGIRLKVAYKCN
jgi:hypothetical protein